MSNDHAGDDSGDGDTPDTASIGAHSERGTVERDPADNYADMTVLGAASAHGNSELFNRYMTARRAGMSFGNQRDYYEVLGYNRSPDAEDYYSKFLRNDIARTIVTLPAQTTWRSRPLISDDDEDGSIAEADEPRTDFEEAVQYLFDSHRLLHYLERLDVVAGIGEYGLLFLGVADGDESGMQELDEPVDDAALRPLTETMDGDEDDLAYLNTFSQARVAGIDTVREPTSRRFGLPEYYSLNFESVDMSATEDVHHTRVIHAAEDLLENEVFGRPRLEAILNRLEDLEKLVGGAAEMTWRGADRKLIIQADADGGAITTGEETVQDEAEEMIHGMRNVLGVRNADVNTIDGESVDPSGAVDEVLKLVAGESGIPKRILTGSERGELASTQDRATFFGRIGERQQHFAEPMILRPVLDRFIEWGLVPPPAGGSYSVEWPDLFELSELEQADLMSTKADALSTASGGAPSSVATAAEIRENIMDWGPELGSETSLDETEDPEQVVDDDGVGEPTDEDREAFDEIDELLGEIDPDAVADPAEAMPDGGEPDDDDT